MDSSLLLLLLLLSLLHLYHTSATRLLHDNHHHALSPHYLSHLHIHNSKMFPTPLLVQEAYSMRNWVAAAPLKKEIDVVDTLLKEEEKKHELINEKYAAVLLARRAGFEENNETPVLWENMKGLVKWDDVDRKFGVMETELAKIPPISTAATTVKGKITELRETKKRLQAEEKRLLELVERTLTDNGGIGRALQPIEVIADAVNDRLDQEDQILKRVQKGQDTVVKEQPKALELSNTEKDTPAKLNVIDTLAKPVTEAAEKAIDKLNEYMKGVARDEMRWKETDIKLKEAEKELLPLPSFADVTTLRERVENMWPRRKKLQKEQNDQYQSIEKLLTSTWCREQMMGINKRDFEKLFDTMDAEKEKEKKSIIQEVLNGKKVSLTSEERDILQKYVSEYEPILKKYEGGMHVMHEIMDEIPNGRSKWGKTVTKVNEKFERHLKEVKSIQGALK